MPPSLTACRCRVHGHKHRAHAHERLHEQITADYNDMIYAATCEGIETRRGELRGSVRRPCRGRAARAAIEPLG